MTSSWTTRLACALLGFGLIAASAAAVLLGLSPWLRPWLGAYHIAADLAAGLLLHGLLSGLAVRLLAAWQPLPPGTHASGSRVYGRWQLLTILTMFGQWSLRPFTPPLLRPLLMRLYGARVGREVAIGGWIDDPWMVAVGDGAVLGNGSLVSGNVLSDGRLVLGRVEIGARALVGANAVVLPGCRLGEGATLQVGSLLVPNSVVGAGEVWKGNPARPWKPTAPAPAPAVEAA